MKKKWLLGLLSGLCIATCALGLSACGEPEKGDKGDTGADGKSAYEIWLDNGHTGTEEDFLNWLKGEDGAPGSPGATGQTGATGATGADGKSAYQIWLDAGNTGTEEDFLNWLKGLNDHDFGDWICFTQGDVSCEERLFYRICNDCSIIEWKNGTADDHDWQEDYLYDNSFHWIKCEDCTTTKDSGEHSVDERGYCTICDNLVGATEGILYDVSGDGTYAEVIGYEGTERKIIIADTYESLPVKNIYVDAFRSKSITSVVIPDSVESIGYAAFAYCDSLTEVAIGDSVETIGDWAFSDCTSLTEIVIPDNVTSIARDAFSSCTSLASVTIGGSVTSIGYSAFYDCTSLTEIVIPDSLTSIGERAFSGCDSLTFNTYGNCKYLGTDSNPYYALIETTATNYSSYQIHEDTKIIADKAFYECSRLSSITIPDNVTSIGLYAFSYCDSLTDVYYKGTASEWSEVSGASQLNSKTRYYYVENEADVPTDGGNYWHYVDGVPTKWN